MSVRNVMHRFGFALIGVAVMGMSAVSPVNAQSKNAWNAEQSGVTLPLAHDWSHEHARSIAELVSPNQTQTETDDASMVEPRNERPSAAPSGVQISNDGVVMANLNLGGAGATMRRAPSLWRHQGALGVVRVRQKRDAAQPPPAAAPTETAAPTERLIVEIAPAANASTPTEPAAPAMAQPVAVEANPTATSAPDPSSTSAAQPPLVEAPATAQTPPSTPAATTVTPPASAPPRVSDIKRESYVLGPLDRIKMIVFQEPELSGEFVIQSSGTVALPLLRDVRAQGLTARELEAAIMQAFVERRLLNDPKVAIEVLSARPFYILGEVQKPGEYPYQTGLSALNAIATAGGFTPLADQTSITVKRAGGSNWETIGLDGGVQIGPGDTVRVDKGAFYILGEVQKAGEYPYSTGMSVLRAVATAQGWTPRAERGRVLITRKGETTQREIQLRPDAPINPGDTIVVLERWF